MRFGVCGTPDQAPQLAELEIDFLEWPVAATVGSIGDRDYEDLAEQLSRLKVVPEAWNVLLPGELRVVGPDVSLARLEDYTEHALSRVSALGGQVVVFGSGQSRAVPAGWPRPTADEQFDAACLVVSAVARRHELVIAIEPLRPDETNLLNTIPEGAALVRRLQEPGLRLLCDLFHMADQHEPMSEVRHARDILAHVHVASPVTRSAPRPSDLPVIVSFFRQIRSLNYDSRISIECGGYTHQAMETGLAVLREAWHRAGEDVAG